MKTLPNPLLCAHVDKVAPIDHCACNRCRAAATIICHEATLNAVSHGKPIIMGQDLVAGLDLEHVSTIPLAIVLEFESKERLLDALGSIQSLHNGRLNG